jgi:hypothetical protein
MATVKPFRPHSVYVGQCPRCGKDFEVDCRVESFTCRGCGVGQEVAWQAFRPSGPIKAEPQTLTEKEGVK